MKTIIFDQNSVGWCKYDNRNRRFLECQFSYLKELLALRGYLYLSQVYETLGAAWNPDDENVCYRKDDRFNVEILPAENGTYMITIN